MATGSLLPLARHIGIDAGVALPGATLDIYSAGTSTRVTTYSDVTLATPNTNPVVADADGLFGPIYIGPISVKVVLKDSSGNIVYTQDNITSPALTAANAVANSVADGRLTVVSGDPAPSSGSSATIRYTHFCGNRIALYDAASGWVVHNFSELSLAVPTTADTNHDIFIYDNAGTLTLESVAWSTSAARATAITRQDGVYVKSGTPTKRYLGTVRVNASNTIPDTLAERFVWNFLNRIPRPLKVVDTANSWTYTTDTFRSANNSTANRIGLLVGVLEEAIQIRVTAVFSNPTAGVVACVGIGEDSTSAAVASSILGAQASTAGGVRTALAEYVMVPNSIGFHFYQWLERSAATDVTTWYGDNGATNVQSGITGMVRG